MFDALFFMPGIPVFGAAAQGILLDWLALVTRGPYLPGFQRTIEIRKIVLGRLPFPGHCTESRMRHTPSPSVKEASLLILEFCH